MSTPTTTPETAELDELCVNTIRTLSMDGVQKANSGHPGTPMALAPIAYVLYTRLMRHSPCSGRMEAHTSSSSGRMRTTMPSGSGSGAP